MIRKLCYELYKVDWKYTHMITAQREIDEIKNYYADLVDSDMEYTYNNYLEEFGYNGELYVSYDEFLDNEYLDEDYMRKLLDDEQLIVVYLQDVNG